MSAITTQLRLPNSPAPLHVFRHDAAFHKVVKAIVGSHHLFTGYGKSARCVLNALCAGWVMFASSSLTHDAIEVSSGFVVERPSASERTMDRGLLRRGDRPMRE